MNALTRPMPVASREIRITRGVVVKSPSFWALAAWGMKRFMDCDFEFWEHRLSRDAVEAARRAIPPATGRCSIAPRGGW